MRHPRIIIASLSLAAAALGGGITAALLEQETVTGDQVRAIARTAMSTASEPSSSTNHISR